MAVLHLLVVLGSLCIGTVESAGYLYKMPHHGEACFYEELKDAHFSYDKDTCRRPQEWCYLHKCWTTCGSDRRQSPIDIESSRAWRSNVGFDLHNKDSRVPAFIYNSGHAPHFTVNETNNDITLRLKNIYGRASNEIYIMRDLHIHLGTSSSKGSEHAIDGKFHPMEAHMVFYNSKYSSINEAKPEKDGLVVIGVMIQVKKKHHDGDDDSDDDDDEYDNDYDESDDEDDEYERGDDQERDEWEAEREHKYTYSRVCCQRNYNDIYNRDGDDYYSKKCYNGDGKCKVRFARTLSHIMEEYYEKIKEYNHEEAPAQETERPSDLQCGKKPSWDLINNVCKRGGGTLPDERYNVDCGISPADVLPFDQRIYTYAGSLTTPPCYETVQWIVFKCPIRVSRRAFKALQKIKDAEQKPLKKHGVRRPLQNSKNKSIVFKNY